MWWSGRVFLTRWAPNMSLGKGLVVWAVGDVSVVGRQLFVCVDDCSSHSAIWRALCYEDVCFPRHVPSPLKGRRAHYFADHCVHLHSTSLVGIQLFMKLVWVHCGTKLIVTKTGRNKDTWLRAAKISWNKLLLYSWKFSCPPGSGNPATKTLTSLRSDRNLIVALLPWLRTCFKRSFPPRHCYFSFSCALRFFNHTSIPKQTNKFRAFAADTNIEMSYEIRRSREKARLKALIHNICTGQDTQPVSHAGNCWPVWCWKRGRWQVEGVGANRSKMIIINCLGAECYDLWSQSGASSGVTLDFQGHLSCGFGSLLYLGFRCLYHTPDIPSPPPRPLSPNSLLLWAQYTSDRSPSLPRNHLSIRTSALHWGLHVSEDLNALNAGTSSVSFWHLTQRLSDLKGRGENYRKWSVTEIKNRPRLPPITLNNAAQAICWSDGHWCYLWRNNGTREREKSGDLLRETATYLTMWWCGLIFTVWAGMLCMAMQSQLRILG